jgi:hypothetical protein
LPLFSSAFRRSHIRHQVPPRPPKRERSQRWKGELWARILSGNFAEMTTSTPFRDLLHAANLRQGTEGFTSPPKEGVPRIFSSLKIRRLRPGLNPRTWVLKASTVPLDHRSHSNPILINNYTVSGCVVWSTNKPQIIKNTQRCHRPCDQLRRMFTHRQSELQESDTYQLTFMHTSHRTVHQTRAGVQTDTERLYDV